MKIKALKTLVGNYGRMDEGMVAELPNWQANQLLALGYVEKFTGDINDGHKDATTQSGQLHRSRRRKDKA